MNDCIQTTFDQYCKDHDLPTGLAPIDILRGSDLTEEEEKAVSAFNEIWNEV